MINVVMFGGIAAMALARNVRDRGSILRRSDTKLLTHCDSSGIKFSHACFIWIFTVRKRSCGKVLFLHMSVSHSVHSGEVYTPGQALPEADTPLADTPWTDIP